MAEESDSGDKTEEPTARRLEKAREDGQVARSMELTSAAVTIGALSLLFASGPWWMDRLMSLFQGSLTFDRRLIFSEWLTPVSFLGWSGHAFSALIPLFILTMILALLAGSFTGGLVFSMKAAAPKGSKINPLNGLKRMFGLRALVELGKALAKFFLVGGAVYVMIQYYLVEMMYLGTMHIEPALTRLAIMLGVSALVAALMLLVIAAIDVPYQRYDFTKNMRMSHKEIRDEMKDVEGNPQVKAKIRGKQRELAMARMMSKVKDADVVITNPQHFAVALQYDPSQPGAPLVIAKGIDELALRIRQEAARHAVREFQSPELARAIYYTTELDRPIPELLYLPVAQVLAYVFKLNETKGGGPKVQRPRPKVPPEMRFTPDGRPAATSTVA